MSALVARRLPGLVEAEVDGELVALHIENGTCYSFNRTAARIWALLDRPKSVAEICADLTGEFDIDADRCAEQVLLLLEDLKSDNLIALDKPAPAA